MYFLKFWGYRKAYISESTKHDKTSTGIHCRDEQMKTCEEVQNQSKHDEQHLVCPALKMFLEMLVFSFAFSFFEQGGLTCWLFSWIKIYFSLFINGRKKLLTQLHGSKVMGFQEKSQISHHWQETHRSVFSWRRFWFFLLWYTWVCIYQEWSRCTWTGFIRATRGCSVGVGLSLAVCGVALPPHGCWFKTSLDRGQNLPSLLWLQRRHILCFFA